MSEMIERVARAIWALNEDTDCKEYSELAPHAKERADALARAAIDALEEDFRDQRERGFFEWALGWRPPKGADLKKWLKEMREKDEGIARAHAAGFAVAAAQEPTGDMIEAGVQALVRSCSEPGDPQELRRQTVEEVYRVMVAGARGG